MAYRHFPKSPPLTEEEIKEKYEEIQEEMKEVLKWKKECEKNLKDPKASTQKKGSAKRTLKKVGWRINTVQGQIIYSNNLFKTSKPLGVSRPDTIDVAYFHFTPDGFDFNTYERFSLK